MLETIVGSDTCSPVFGMLVQFDARVVKTLYTINGAVCRTIIGDDDLKILKSLIQDTLNAFLNILFVIV
jgi:hypothetical protein